MSYRAGMRKILGANMGWRFLSDIQENGFNFLFLNQIQDLVHLSLIKDDRICMKLPNLNECKDC